MSQGWIGVLVVVALAMFVWMRSTAGGGAGGDRVRERIAAGATIVDVRTPEEFAGGAYPGAVNIPLQALGSRLGEIPRDKPVVVYCRSGGRSSQAATLLGQAGYGDVTNGGGLSSMPR